MNNKEKKILIIDDEQWNLNLLERLLKSEGFSVESKVDSRLALALALKEDYFCIILDLQMSILSGLEFIEELKQKGKCVANIIIVSGYVSSAQKKLLESKNIHAIVNKPIDFDLLLSHIASIKNI